MAGQREACTPFSAPVGLQSLLESGEEGGRCGDRAFSKPEEKELKKQGLLEVVVEDLRAP